MPQQWLCTVILAVTGLWVAAPPIVALILFFTFSFFNAIYSTLTSIYPGEILPTEIRGIGGIPLRVSLTGGHPNDITQLLPLVTPCRPSGAAAVDRGANPDVVCRLGL